MDGEAIRRLEEMVLKGETKTQNGVQYVRGDYHALGVRHDETVRFSTLEDFCLFAKRNPQNQEATNPIIVVNPNFTVSLLSAPNPYDGRRTELAMAKAHDVDGFRFGNTYDVEAFIIALKSKFDSHDSDWEAVFNLVRKVQIEEGVELNDDGMSQKVTIKKGVSAASVEAAVKPVDYALRPYRIFPEVEQPKSVFFLRLSGNKEFGVKVALFETDGGAWKIDAARTIRDFIISRIGDSGIPVYC